MASILHFESILVLLEIISLRDRYHQCLQQAGFSADSAQETAIACLQTLYEQLLQREVGSVWWHKWWWRPIKGLYLWGGVGRGKTWLMDIFYASLPFEKKWRLHFHQFMQRVHKELQLLSAEKNPLKKVAKKFAKETAIICFDEFFVEDIADAMLMTGLLTALFQQGVVLVATSNVMPRDLYKKGILRERFLPAIMLIEQQMNIIEVDSGIDYRMKILTENEIYNLDNSEKLTSKMSALFKQLAVGEPVYGSEIVIYHRALATVAHASNIVWFEFNVLCETARSQYDYLEIATLYAIVMVSHVPALTADREDAARRFIHLVDVFYDNNIKLILSAELPIAALYTGRYFQFEFKRTMSRLVEMQTQDYWQKAHKQVISQSFPEEI